MCRRIARAAENRTVPALNQNIQIKAAHSDVLARPPVPIEGQKRPQPLQRAVQFRRTIGSSPAVSPAAGAATPARRQAMGRPAARAGLNSGIRSGTDIRHGPIVDRIVSGCNQCLRPNGSGGPPPSGVDVDHGATPDLSLQNRRAEIEYVGKSMILHHGLQFRHRQIGPDTPPGRQAILIGAHDAIDPQKIDAPQQERNHGCRQLGAARQPHGGDRSAIDDLGQDPCQHPAADRIDAARPGFALQRLRRRFRDFVPSHDLRRAQIFQIVRRFRSACDRRNIISEMRQDRGGDRPDTARCPGNQNRQAARFQSMGLQRHHRQHGGEPCGADRHRLLGGQTLRQRNQPVGLDPRLLGITAPPDFPDAPAGQDHLVARLEA